MMKKTTGIIVALCLITVQISFLRPSSQAVRSGHVTFRLKFSEIAARFKPVTDKLTAHHYETIYDAYLSYTEAKIRLLEIGLGCDMDYGPGASANVWPELFPNGDIWFAEYDAVCAKSFWNGPKKWRYVSGDQSDEDDLRRWVTETGGNFDYIVDDGYRNKQIWNSFQELFFKALKPGGVYFIEDLHLGRYAYFHSNGLPDDSASVMIDVLTDWMDQLVVKSGIFSHHKEVVKKSYKYSLPDEILRIDCIRDMCAITKAP